mmetsp:Transcript_11292/g.31411  ORF Transcript_11292/g.31411 Transcript_11292/m.31411 type:complete len:104 (-) Transcript_11292:47-358(-)
MIQYLTSSHSRLEGARSSSLQAADPHLLEGARPSSHQERAFTQSAEVQVNMNTSRKQRRHRTGEKSASRAARAAAASTKDGLGRTKCNLLASVPETMTEDRAS